MAGTQFQGFPRGWFVIAFSDDIGVGEVRSMEYFGQRLVAFRTESGQVRVLDAHCPHLGADLGVGGTVEGESIRCPFHAWRFDGAGTCIDVPYAKKIPPKAKTRSWDVSEKNGVIFVWHDRQGNPPTYEMPTIEVYGHPDWLPWNGSCLRIRTHPREIVENVADKAHFPRVHGTHVDEFENEYIDHMAIQKTKGIAYPRGGGKDHFALTATYYGPGCQITEMDSFIDNRLLLAHTPIDEEFLDLRFGVSLKIGDDQAQTEAFSSQYADNLRTGFHEDIAIWENKLYRERPILCDGDGPIAKLRRWYMGFYETVN